MPKQLEYYKKGGGLHYNGTFFLTSQISGSNASAFRRPQVLSFSHWWWLLSWNGGLQGWRLWGSSPPNYIQGKAPALFVPTPNSPFSPLKLTWNGSMLPLAWYCAQKIRWNLTQSKIYLHYRSPLPMADFLPEHFWVNSYTSVEVNNYRQPMWSVATVLPSLTHSPLA